jgi:hypothetical protein
MPACEGGERATKGGAEFHRQNNNGDQIFNHIFTNASLLLICTLNCFKKKLLLTAFKEA